MSKSIAASIGDVRAEAGGTAVTFHHYAGGGQDSPRVYSDIEISVFIGDDGATVVQIDTVEGGGRLRVNVNDAPVWDRDPETGEAFGDWAEPDSDDGPACLTCGEAIRPDDDRAAEGICGSCWHNARRSQ